MSDVFIVGLGYVGGQVAQQETGRDHRVIALARSDDAASRCRQLHVEPLMGDLDDLAGLSEVSVRDAVVYYFAPPPAYGERDPRIGNLLACLKGDNLPSRFILISTTGVYGDCAGDWIDETRPLAPQVDRARRRVHAEQQLTAWSMCHPTTTVILRVPGIYGPDKLPLQRLREGKAVLAETDAPYSNRIHVNDLVRCCIAAADHPEPAAIYNVTDGHPTTMTDYFNQVAKTFDLPAPPQISAHQAQASMSEGMLSYLSESKRIDNRLMREHLGVEPDFPDLESGLEHCRMKMS